MKGLVRLLANSRKFSLIGICLLATMSGCSSRLQTTVMSETWEPAKTAKAELPPAPVKEIEPGPPTIEPPKRTSSINIPVEEPARPTIRPSRRADIFAAPQSEITEPPTSPIPSAPIVVEPTPPISTEKVKPTQPSAVSKAEPPPVEIEPEMPALPMIRGPKKEEVVPSQELVAKVEPEQVQEVRPVPVPEEPKQESAEMPPPTEIAKVIPPSPERVEAILEPLKDVFFDYDRFAIRPDAARVLKENASSLMAGLSDKSLVIEGHCDERGTSSYNMVLGERRANAVKEFLIHLGVQKDKLKVVSYGKERPFCTEQTQECWQENRRGHFVLK